MNVSVNTENGAATRAENKPEQDEDDVETPEPDASDEATSTRSLRTVVRAIERHHVRALMLEHTATMVMNHFAGNEAQGPKYWLKVPGGGPFIAFHDDVHELEMDLLEMASMERTRVAELMTSPVAVSAGAVDLERPPYRPFQPVPEGEGVVPTNIPREVYGKMHQRREAPKAGG
jgi:hypothetical protein